jgi:hypothetical protein
VRLAGHEHASLVTGLFGWGNYLLWAATVIRDVVVLRGWTGAATAPADGALLIDLQAGTSWAAAAAVDLDFRRGNGGHVTSMRTLAAQPPMKEASTRAFIGFVACCSEGSLLKKRKKLRIKEDVAFFKEKLRKKNWWRASVSLTLIHSFSTNWECGFPHNGAIFVWRKFDI